MKRIKISVIVVNWNGGSMLEDCLASVFRQTFQDFEVIVVDNGSTDNSLELVKNKFPRANRVSLNVNLGFSGGNNEGFRHAQGEYLALLNNDAVADPCWLEELHREITSSPEIGFCASKILFFGGEDIIDSAGDGMGACGVGFKIGNAQPGRNYSDRREVFGACGAAAIFRRSMLEEIGFFDEDLFCIHEDVDLSFRARLKGFKCLYVPTAIVYHKCNGTLGLLSDTYVYYGHRNAEIVYLKNMPRKLILKYFHHHVIYNILALIYFVLKGKGGVFLNGKYDFIKMLPEILKKRKIIQASRITEVGKVDSFLEKNWLMSRKGGKW